ncbi:hypothetical protein [Pseudactinotalea sp. Z1748]|uniref:ApeA N-terminal domain 1-containing protein n=1 Tax=Pseudactinotalea sp. Z1748 TaxID=3413027 RepID=UPI003C7C51C4
MVATLFASVVGDTGSSARSSSLRRTAASWCDSPTRLPASSMVAAKAHGWPCGGKAMTDTFDLRGKWWLPDSEDHQVFGTLTWSADSGGELHLHDELRPVAWLDKVLADGSVQKYRVHRGGFQQTYPLIFGRVGDRAYTLLDSFRLSAREYGSDLRAEKVHVNRFLEGAWFEDPDELSVDRIVIDIRHLTGWVGHSGLEVEYPRIEGTDKDLFAVITAKTLPALSIEEEDLTFRLTQGLRGTGDYVHDLGVAQEWSLQIQTPEPQPLATFLATASDFQDLVSIATGKTAQFEKVVLHHPDIPLLSVAGTPIGDARDDITYYIRWSNRTAPCDPIKRHEMYFSFADLGGIEGLGRWLAVAADYRTELGRVMATRYREAMVIEDRIFNVSAALDSFDKHRRTTGKHVKYAKRIKQCVDLAGQPFLDLIVIDPHLWVERVVTTRDDLAHHRQQIRTDGTVGDHLLAEQLFWLFALCMLRLSDAPDVVYDGISKHRKVRWLTERANASRTEPA